MEDLFVDVEGNLLKNTLNFLWHIRWYLVTAIIFCLGLLTIGILASLASPVVSDNPAANPLNDIVRASSDMKSDFIITSLGKNLVLTAFLFLSSIIQFSLVTFGVYGLNFFATGIQVGWFQKFPGTSIFSGILSSAGSLIPQILAYSLVMATSMWICASLLRPDADKSKWLTIKSRYQKSLVIILPVAFLIILSVLVEGLVSIPAAAHFGQTAIASENTKTISNDSAGWQLMVPDSWQESEFKDASLVSGKGVVTRSSLTPLFIETAVKETNMALSDEDIQNILPQQQDAIFSKHGMTTFETKNINIGGHSAIRVKARGNDTSVGGNPEIEIYYLIYSADIQANKTTNYSIFVRDNPDFFNFDEPQIERIVQSFQVI